MIQFERKGIIMGPKGEGFGKSARFNPGVVKQGDVVHLLYRSADNTISDKKKYVSTIGYSKLDLYGNIIEDYNKPVIYPQCAEESMGCEDPRIVFFEGKYFVFYTAYDGYTARVGVVETKDFVSYKRLGFINHYTWDKDAFIFPERINGEILYLHRIEPFILMDSFHSIDELLCKDNWKGYEDRIKDSILMKPEFPWEEKKIGGSMPPVKTDKGWLFIYHGVDKNMVYKSSAVLLDLKNPMKILSRIAYPLLQPEEQYEVKGDVPNVVFPEGGYVHDGKLYIYYGAADKCIALATVEINDLLNEMEKYSV